MITEVIDKLFLELSQVTTAKTKRELHMERMLEEANDHLRSCFQVIEREGKETNWIALNHSLKRVLEKQHEFMYPKGDNE